MRMPIVRHIATLALALLTGAPASANDSYATLGAGGLRLEATDAVAMEQEDLFLSREEVRVAYVFRTLAPRDVEAVVAFPFPDIDTAMAANVPLLVPGRKGENFLDFEVSVDGRRVTPALEIRAVLPGPPEKDVTALLAKHGIPLAVFTPDFFAGLDRLPAAALADLKAAGAADVDEYEDAKGRHVSVIPLWHVRSAYHWRQTFPAGRTVTVEHRYKPFVGYFWLPQKPDAETAATFCIDPPTAAGLARRIAAMSIPGFQGHAQAADLSYVLKTARNWAGPIRRFRLTIDKGQPDTIVSLCMDGLRKIAPTRFTAEFTDFVPTRDLRVLFAPAVPPDQN